MKEYHLQMCYLFSKIGVFPSNFVEMCAGNNESLSPIKPNLNNKQQQNNQIDHQNGSSANLQGISKKNSVKHAAAAVADKNKKNETNNGVSDSVPNMKGGKFLLF